VNIAVDGETFGHHHRFGDMALSYCIDYISSGDRADLTVYGEMLEKYPPEYEVDINENSSWSCSHGVERWRSDCGCHSGHQPSWNQSWRKPLRESLDWLRDEINIHFEEVAGRYVSSPWELRDLYWGIILSGKNNSSTLKKYLKVQVPGTESEMFKLFELQKFMMMMYTSCGWFFDDVAGLESRLVLRFAVRVIQLAEEMLGLDFEPEFLKRMEAAESNYAEYRNASEVLKKEIFKEKIDPMRTAVYFAISLLFDESFENTEKFHYEILKSSFRKQMVNESEYLNGVIAIRDSYTFETSEFLFCVKNDLFFDIQVYLQRGADNNRLAEINSSLVEFAGREDKGELTRYLESIFERSYSLQHVFRDKQYEISCKILNEATQELHKTHNDILVRNYRVIRYFRKENLPVPDPVRNAVGNAISFRLTELFREDDIDPVRIKRYLYRMKRFSIRPDTTELGHVASLKIYNMMKKIRPGEDQDLLNKINDIIEILSKSSVNLHVYKVQNHYYKMWKDIFPEQLKKAEVDEKTALWVELFKKTGKSLKMAIQ